MKTVLARSEAMSPALCLCVFVMGTVFGFLSCTLDEKQVSDAITHSIFARFPN